MLYATLLLMSFLAQGSSKPQSLPGAPINGVPVPPSGVPGGAGGNETSPLGASVPGGNESSPAVPAVPGGNETALAAPAVPGGNETSPAVPAVPGGNETAPLGAAIPGGNETSPLGAEVPVPGGNETSPLGAGVPGGNETSPVVPAVPGGNETLPLGAEVPVPGGNETSLPGSTAGPPAAAGNESATPETAPADGTPTPGPSVEQSAAEAAALVGGGENLVCICKPSPEGPSGTYICRCAPTLAELASNETAGPNGTSPSLPIEGGAGNETAVGGEATPPPGGNQTEAAGNETIAGGPVEPSPAPSLAGGNETTPAAGGNETTAGGGEVAPPAGGNVTIDGEPIPGAGLQPGSKNKTFVMCVKLANSSVPSSDYLTGEQGKSVSVNGEWIEYKCKWGHLEAFLITREEYDGLTQKCVAKGFEFPQPSDDQHSATYPFQYELIIGPYFRHRTPFSFNRVPETPADRCTGERKRRRNRNRNRNRNRRTH